LSLVEEDRKAAAVIRDTAMRLFGQHGAAVTVRQIAEAAGVSPALVMHHYGSKRRLEEALDARAGAFVEEMLGEMTRVGEPGAGASFAQLLVERFEREPALADYVRRLLLYGGDAGDALFRQLLDSSERGMRNLVAAGVARPAADERLRSSFLLVNDLAMLLLRRQLQDNVGFDPLSREGIEQWTASALDVYAGGLFAIAVPDTCPGRDAETPAG
jgi:TetR/AcrR family transcriptional regulator, regulator of cefoperazone and chloramphenicol sensitivity